MILYIASNKNEKIIESAINECKKAVFERYIEERFDITLFMKQKIDQLEPIEILIIDESALENTDEEIIKAISSFRILYEDKKIIYISEKRSKGDRLLSEIFGLGIYNIVAEENKDTLQEEIKYCIQYGKSFRESIIYKESSNEAKEGTEIIRERIIIKNEIKTNVNKALIGFTGTQNRIGVTHTAISAANYLKNKGFKIALIEEKGVEFKAFELIKETYQKNIIDNEYFRLNGVDYYPDYDIKNIHKVLNKNYNLVLIDFGLFKNKMIFEFNRCVMPIIVCGTKPWEIENINKIFETVSEEELKEYFYIFNLTDDADKESIIEGMGALKKVYFTGININPFEVKDDVNLDNIFKEYIPEIKTKIQTKGGLFSMDRLKGMVGKIKWKSLL